MNDIYYLQYLLYIAAFAVIMIANARMQSAYHRYRKIDTEKGYTGAQTARMILDANGLQDVTVQLSNGGSLSDHYNPMDHTVNLSADIYYKTSIASVSVAAHEVGHAIQHKEGYGAIELRNRILPLANIASQLGWGVLFLGLIFSIRPLLMLGIAALCIVAVFQIITLPIEFNASKRALMQLESLAIVDEAEQADAQSMLKAAALTYVAALINTVFQILRMLLISGRRNND